MSAKIIVCRAPASGGKLQFLELKPPQVNQKRCRMALRNNFQ
jgi:hypothetical protein